MTATIIVPLDGSLASERALPPALELVEGFGAELVVFRAGWDSDGGADQAYLDEVVRRCGEVRVRAFLAHGFPEEPLVELVDREPDAVVCMTTRGHTGLGATLFGSVAEHVLGHVRRPVVLIGPACQPRDRRVGGGHLVLCFDGSATSAAMAAPAIEWARALDLDVHVAMVLHHDGEYLADHLAGPDTQAAHELTERLRVAGLHASLHLLDGIDPSRAVDSFARTLPAALIATATHGGGDGLARSTVGRVATRITRHSPCPVLVCRA